MAEANCKSKPKRGRFIPSALILSAVAVAWTAGMLLLHFFFVGPRLDRQGQRMDQDVANQWLSIASDALQVQRESLQRVSAGWAHDPTVVSMIQQHNLPGLLEYVRQSRPMYIHELRLALLSEQTHVLLGWKYNGREVETIEGWNLSNADVDRPIAEQKGLTDITQTPEGLMVYACMRLEGSDECVLAICPLSRELLGKPDLLANAVLEIQPVVTSTTQAAISPWAGPEAVRLEDHSLQVRKPLTDRANHVVAMLTIRGSAGSSWNQRQAVSASLLTTLVWAGGFALLMVVLIHAMISGPTARLLHRVEHLKSGETGDLSKGLRGEAMVLAKRFEAVLGQAERLSETDSLTGVNNRRSFHQFFVREFHRAKRYNRPLTLAVLDLDYLKAANDVLGHQTGDMIIELFARVIAEHVRTSDSIARLGGDEFAVLMPETDEANGAKVMERIRAGLAQKSAGRGQVKITPTASIGVCDLSVAGVDSPDSLFNTADRAMYVAKRGGRNQVVLASLMPEGDAQLPAEQNKVDHLCRQLAGLDAKFKRLFVEAIGGLINALEARDEHTANHSVKVRRYAMLIAKEMSLPQGTVEHLGRAAMLHDIGKIGLPDCVLLKPGVLTPEEWEIVKGHPVTGVRIMEGMEFLDQEIPAVRYHHERFDGRGYPEGLAGSAIPLAARILAVADSFDAMTSARVYRDGMPVQKAVDELRKNSGLQFDPAVVDVFLKVVEHEHITDETIHQLTETSA